LPPIQVPTESPGRLLPFSSLRSLRLDLKSSDSFSIRAVHWMQQGVGAVTIRRSLWHACSQSHTPYVWSHFQYAHEFPLTQVVPPLCIEHRHTQSITTGTTLVVSVHSPLESAGDSPAALPAMPTYLPRDDDNSPFDHASTASFQHVRLKSRSPCFLSFIRGKTSSKAPQKT